MNTIRVPVAVLVVVLLQTMVLNRFEWLQTIDLFLLMNVYFALHFDQVSCMALSLSTGLIEDAFSEGIMGMNAFSKTVLAYLIGVLSSRIVIKQPFLSLLVGLTGALDFFILYGLHRLFSLSGFPLSFKVPIAAVFLNALASLPLFWVGDKIRNRKEYV